MIIGCPGSGKSTFARKLHSVTNIPLYHLDMIYWNSDKTVVSQDVFLSKLLNIIKEDEWIIDGNYESSMELRIKESDTVIFLDYPLDICLQGIEERKGKPRLDMPWIEPEEPDKEFMDFIMGFNSNNRPKIIELLNKYNDKNILIFNDRDSVNSYLYKFLYKKKV